MNFLVHNFSPDFISLSIVIWFDACVFFLGGFSTFMLLDCICAWVFFPQIVQWLRAKRMQTMQIFHINYIVAIFMDGSISLSHFEWLAKKKTKVRLNLQDSHLNVSKWVGVFFLYLCVGNHWSYHRFHRAKENKKNNNQKHLLIYVSAWWIYVQIWVSISISSDFILSEINFHRDSPNGFKSEAVKWNGQA